MLYWGCAAAGFVVLGLWMTAGYALHHPDSVAACCFKGVYHAGLGLCSSSILRAGAGSMSGCDEDEVVEIPLDPEPVDEIRLLVNGCDLDKTADVATQTASLESERRGRLPGKIIIDDGEEPPLASLDRLASEPNLDRFVAKIEAQWKSDDAADGTNVTAAFWQTTTEYVRPMPYCQDDDRSGMPPAADPDLAPRKKEPPRIWFPFMPKGTEVGGDEKELSPNGNDCREDPSIPLQLPGCLNPKLRESKKVPMSVEEGASKPQEPQNKQSRPIEGPKAKRFFDPAKLQPFAAP
jgi:hypothetical protein